MHFLWKNNFWIPAIAWTVIKLTTLIQYPLQNWLFYDLDLTLWGGIWFTPVSWLIGLLLIRFFAIPLYYWSAEKPTKLRILLIVLGLPIFAFTYAFFTLSVLQFFYPSEANFLKDSLPEIIAEYLSLHLSNISLFYLMVISGLYAIQYFKEREQQALRNVQMQRMLMESKLQNLKTQLQPHFLFNTHNSISALMDIDIQRARNMLTDLSDLLRHILDFQEDQLIPLPKEMELLQKYLDIEKIRFSDHLQIEITTAPGLETILVPSLLLQPLVENAIKHGFSDDHPSLIIKLNIYKEENTLYILVQNNGKALDSQDLEVLFQKGIGLQNTYDRLKFLYGDSFTMSFANEPTGVFCLIKIEKYDTHHYY